jgi:hypothetical protein
MECFYPASEDLSHPHGLKDSIYPLEVNAIVGVEEIQAY